MQMPPREPGLPASPLPWRRCVIASRSPASPPGRRRRRRRSLGRTRYPLERREQGCSRATTVRRPGGGQRSSPPATRRRRLCIVLFHSARSRSDGPTCPDNLRQIAFSHSRPSLLHADHSAVPERGRAPRRGHLRTIQCPVPLAMFVYRYARDAFLSPRTRSVRLPARSLHTRSRRSRPPHRSTRLCRGHAPGAVTYVCTPHTVPPRASACQGRAGGAAGCTQHMHMHASRARAPIPLTPSSICICNPDRRPLR